MSQSELERLRQALVENEKLLAEIDRFNREREKRREFFERKSFGLDEAFKLLRELEPLSTEYRHVALAMLPATNMSLTEAISALSRFEEIVLDQNFDKKLASHAEKYFERVRETVAVRLLDLEDIADALLSIKEARLSKTSTDMLRGAVKRGTVYLTPSLEDCKKGLRSPTLRSMVTDIVTRQVAKKMRRRGFNARQIATALQQQADLLGFPASAASTVAANDPRLSQWLRDRNLARADWICLNPNAHLPKSSPKLASVFAFRDPNFAFEFKLTFV